MCFDTEKTQAPGRDAPEMAQHQVELRAAGEYLGGANANQRLYTDEETLAEIFKYHPPNAETLPRFTAVNQAAKNFAEVVLANCPHGRDRRFAILAIRVARMMANAAISLRGLQL